MLKTDTGAQTAERSVGGSLGAPPVPNDHGAYAMILLPMLLGFVLGTLRGLAPGLSPLPAFTLFAVSLLALFFASEPVGTAFKPNASATARRRALSWLGIYLLVGCLAGAPLLFVWGLWGLAWFLVPAVVLMLIYLLAVKARKQRSLGFRLPGIICLTLSGPAAYYVATGRLDATAFGLAAACAIYFAGTVFNVRAWFEANRQKKAGIANPKLPAWLVASIFLYLAVSAVLIAACAVWGALPWLAFVAFAPSLARAVWTLWRVPYHIPIKTVGLIEFGQSFLFSLLLVLTVAPTLR